MVDDISCLISVERETSISEMTLLSELTTREMTLVVCSE